MAPRLELLERPRRGVDGRSWLVLSRPQRSVRRHGSDRNSGSERAFGAPRSGKGVVPRRRNPGRGAGGGGEEACRFAALACTALCCGLCRRARRRCVAVRARGQRGCDEWRGRVYFCLVSKTAMFCLRIVFCGCAARWYGEGGRLCRTWDRLYV